MPTIRTLLVKIGFVTNSAPLERAHRKTNRFKNDAQGLGSALRGAAAAMGLFAAGRVALGAVDKRLAFGEQLGLLQTFLGGNISRTKELESSIRDLATATGKPLGDVTRGMAEVVSAFGDGEQTVERTRVALDAARAGFTDTLSAVKLLSAVTKGYGDTSAAAMTKVSDLSFQVVKDGQTTFPELAGAIGRVVPVANAAGVKIEELMAVFATGTGVIGDAAAVGTAARAALVQMLNPTDDMAKALRKFRKEGIKSGSELIKRKGMVGAMRALVATTDGSAESINKLFKNVRGQGLVLALTGGQAAAFDRKLGNAGRTAGNTAKAVAAATGGFNSHGAALKRAEVRAEKLQVRLGSQLLPGLVALKIKALEAAEVIADDLGLAFGDVQKGAEDSLNPFREFAKLISFVVKGLGLTLGTVKDLLTFSTRGLAAGAAALTLDEKDRKRLMRQFRAQNLPLLQGMGQRFKDVGQSVIDPEGLRQRRRLAELGRSARAELAEGTPGQRLEVRIDRIVAQIPEGVSAEAQGRIIANELEKVLSRTKRDMARSARRGIPRPAQLGAE